MSAGTVHLKASQILTIGFVVGSVLTWDAVPLNYAVGSMVGIYITPDLDVDAGNITDKIIRQKLGKKAEDVWDAFWYMYRRSLKHGGELSHLPVIGTLGRIAYVYLLLIVIPHTVYYYIFQPSWNLIYVLYWYGAAIAGMWKIWLGLMGADAIHWVFDQIDLLIKDLP